MTKGQALQEWFSQFLTAYSTSSVPDDAVFPWLTYELITGAWDSGEIGLTVNLWYVLASDFSNIERKIDVVNNGICDGFYAMNTGMLNGFAGVTQAVTSGFSQAELSRCNQQAALMQQLNNMAMQAANCCCETREAIQGINYNLATQACDTRNTVQNSTRDIIDAMNCGFRSIDQRLTAQELAAKDAKIAEQNQQLFAAQLAASQAAQNNYLVSTLRPSPSPAYVVANPYCCNSGYNYGCGNCA